MHILYLATSFPNEEQGDTIYTDLAEQLVSQGHKVTVIVPDEKRRIASSTMNEERKCTVLRVKTGNFYNVNKFEKGISFFLMNQQLIRDIKNNLKDISVDLILFESPPVTNVPVIKYLKKTYKCKSYLMLKDIFPQNAVDLNLFSKNSLLFYYYRNKEKKLYDTADQIGVMSKGNLDYLLEHNPTLSKEKVEIFPNTKKIKNINCLANKSIILDKYKIPDNATIFIFGGNMGKPQAIPFLCKTLANLKNEDVFFILIGRGTEKKYLQKQLQEHNINNVLLFDNLPRTQYEELLQISDVGLVLLDSRFTIPNYPSRILSYMEYSKPVLVATDDITDIKELVTNVGCGIWSSSADLSSFCNNILYMHENTYERILLGRNGRNYLEKNFNVSLSVEIIERFYKKNNDTAEIV